MVEVACTYCDKIFPKCPCDVKRFPNNFCSQICYKTFQQLFMGIVQEERFTSKLISDGYLKTIGIKYLKLILACGVKEPALSLCRKELWSRKLAESQ